MTTDALKKLHTAMLDTREGYEVAEKDAATPALSSFFGEMVALRTKDHEAIHRVLQATGEHPDDGGSFMATVHKTVTSLRAAVTGLDDDALSAFIGGEKKILASADQIACFGDLQACAPCPAAPIAKPGTRRDRLAFRCDAAACGSLFAARSVPRAVP